jgi:thymidylate kinase
MKTIVLEGPDGSGKTTLAGLIVGRFNEALGCGAVEYWSHQRAPNADPWQSAIAYAAQRARVATRFAVSPEYQPDALVLDRWWPSNYAQGGVATTLALLEADALPTVDVIIWCSADDDMLDQRIESRGEPLLPNRHRVRTSYSLLSNCREPRWSRHSLLIDTSAAPSAAFEAANAWLEPIISGARGAR